MRLVYSINNNIFNSHCKGAASQGQSGATSVRLLDPDLYEQEAAPVYARQGIKVAGVVSWGGLIALGR